MHTISEQEFYKLANPCPGSKNQGGFSIVMTQIHDRTSLQEQFSHFCMPVHDGIVEKEMRLSYPGTSIQ
jgi:hypothetical protein